MTGDTKYVLDADVFMTAARRYYAFDIAPTFWQSLVVHASNGRLLSIDHVKADIDRGKDELAEWANGSFRQWFDSTAQADVLEDYRRIVTWAQGQNQYTGAAKAEFANASDGWLVAYAKAKGFTVVTNETHDPSIRRRIKIPNVCQAFGVPYVDTFKLMRDLGVKLG